MQLSVSLPLKILANFYVWSLFILILVLPTIQLLVWSTETFGDFYNLHFAIYNTFLLAFTCALFVVATSLALSMSLRWARQSFVRWESVSTVGYSIPGTVLAVAFLVVAITLGQELTFTVSVTFLIFGLSYKFFSVGFRNIGGRVQMISPQFEEISKSMGVSWLRQLSRVHWPILKGSVFSSFALTFVEVMKEMPITLMLAPSSMKTLSIQIYNFTAEGEWEKAAIPSLILVLMGVATIHWIPPRGSNA